MPWRKVRLAVNPSFTSVWLVDAETLERIKDSPETSLSLDEIKKIFPFFMVKKGLKLSMVPMKECAICEKLKMRGIRLKSGATVRLFVCRDCINESGIDACRMLISC